MNRKLTRLGAGLGAALFLSGLAAAQSSSPADFDRGAPAPEAILHELAASAAAMPAVPGKAPSTDEALIPPLPANTKKEYLKLFHDGFLKAIQRLRAPKCAAFYGEGAEAKFEATKFEFMPLGRPQVNEKGLVSVTGAQVDTVGPPPAAVFINSEGPFITQSMYVMGKSGFQTLDLGTGLRGSDFDALLLLHELGHIMGKFGPDAHDSELNHSYSMQVRKYCF